MSLKREELDVFVDSIKEELQEKRRVDTARTIETTFGIGSLPSDEAKQVFHTM